MTDSHCHTREGGYPLGYLKNGFSRVKEWQQRVIIFSLVSCSQNHNLLSDFACHCGCQDFEVIYCVIGLRVVEVLNVEKGELSDQREHLGAVIQVPAKLVLAKGMPGRMLCPCIDCRDTIRIFRELMRIDYMCEAAQPVRCGDDAFPFSARLECHEENHACAYEHNFIESGLRRLNKFRQAERTRFEIKM